MANIGRRCQGLGLFRFGLSIYLSSKTIDTQNNVNERLLMNECEKQNSWYEDGSLKDSWVGGVGCLLQKGTLLWFGGKDGRGRGGKGRAGQGKVH